MTLDELVEELRAIRQACPASGTAQLVLSHNDEPSYESSRVYVPLDVFLNADEFRDEYHYYEEDYDAY